MSASVTTITPPVKLAVEVGDLTQHMRGETGALDGDAHARQVISSAVAYFERRTNSSLITRTLRLSLDGFREIIYLHHGPVQSVTAVKYLDAEGQQQTLNPSLYHVDLNHSPARLTVAYGETWPDTRLLLGAVTIDYTTGYGDSSPDVPDDITAALLTLATHFTDHQTATSTLTLKEVPMSAGAVIDNRHMPGVL